LYEKNRDETRKKFGLGDKTVFVFQGHLNKNRGLEELQKALPFCQKLSEVFFLIVGDGSYKQIFEQEIKSKNYQNFIFTGRVNYLELSKYLSACDVGMVFYPPICLNYVYAAPNKLYEYMMNNLAILSNNIVTIRKVVEREDCGICYENGEQSLAEKIDYFVENKEKINEMKKRGFESAMLKYNWEFQEKKLLDIYKNL
jgi:glycosyltransferase involved in cell wall biosynthesis